MDCFAALAMTAELSEIGWLQGSQSEKVALMKATAKATDHLSSSDIAARVDAIDWTQATADLDGQGCAVLKELRSPAECQALGARPDRGCDEAFIAG